MGNLQSGDARGVWHIGPSRIHGNGVILSREIAAGALVGVGIGYVLGFIPTITADFGAWINHSNRPSCSLLFLNGNYWVVANRTMEGGEEVTVDYRKTPWYIRGPEANYV